MEWVYEEFTSVDLGDKRLNKRLKKVCGSLYQRPMSPINEACQAWNDTKAAYRLFENDKITAQRILSPHRERTVIRAQQYPIVLAIQDTTFFNFSQHKRKRNMGSIESKRRHVIGILAHNTLITTTDGTPLGLFDQEIYSRAGQKYEPGRHKVPIEEKEDFRWVKAAETVISYMPTTTRVVTVCDREADIYEFLKLFKERNADYLIRSSHNRIVGIKKKRWEPGENTYLNDVVEKEARKGTIRIEVIDAKTKQKRIAHLAIKFCATSLAEPWRFNHSYKNQDTLDCFLIDVEELEPSPDFEKIHWRLLTSLSVNSLEDAIEKVLWYKQRWTIEVFHKVLKSGCKVEECRLSDLKRLQRCITLYSIIAWRLLWITRINHETPDIPCTIAFSNEEWKVLYIVKHKTKELPKDVPTLRTVIRWMAQLGGFLARKSDGEPGITAIWRGWQQLNIMARTYESLTYG